MARAKQTGRSEARRRYRQSTAPIEADGEGELLEPGDDAEPERPSAKAAPARPADNRPPSGRLGFGASFRLAYHPPNIREDIRTLPTTLRSRGFLAAVLMVIVGGVVWFAYPVYSGSITAWELLVLPGSALAPQLVAGFFAPRASYLLGLVVGLVQPVVYLARELERPRPGGIPRSRRSHPRAHRRPGRAGVLQLGADGWSVRGDGGLVPALPGPLEPAQLRRGPRGGGEQVVRQDAGEALVEAHREPLAIPAGACRRGPSGERRPDPRGRRPVRRRSSAE